MSDPRRPAQIAADFARLRASAVETQHRIAAISATMTSPQGLVTVTAGAQGEVTAITFNSQDYRRTAPAELAHIVLETIQRARQSVLNQLSKEMPTTSFNGMTFRDILDGTADLDRMLPNSLDLGGER